MNTAPPGPAVVRFGVFELDVASGVLRKAGVRLNLQTQPLQVLTALLERPGAVVTREELRQRLWADDTFVDFERGLNAAVKRLRDTLGDVAETPRFIETMPRRGYRFVAPVEIAGATPSPAIHTSAPVPAVRRSWRSAVAVAAVLVVVAVVVVWILPRSEAPRDAPMRAVPLTTMNGFEAGGISPDGREAAFEWGGERDDNQDIYLKLVGSSDMRRLTTDPARDIAPVWSHDGRQIVYVRMVTPPADARIRVVSPLGGGDRQVSEFPVQVPAHWSPDDRYLVAGRRAPPGETDPDSGIYLIPLQGGLARALTHPKPPQIDMMASFSPDGRRLAYVSCTDQSSMVCHVNVLEVDGTMAAAAPPHRLTTQAMPIAGLCWTSDGRELVFGGYEIGFSYLWRVAVDGRAPPSRIDIAGNGALFPSIVGGRLSFTSAVTDIDMYRVQDGRPPEAVARSSAFDGNISLAPDGRRFAYCSQRSGDSIEIWVATLDGSDARQLTRGANGINCSPSWSPDGRRIAFDSRSPDGSWHVWSVDPEGGTPRQITTDPGDQNLPAWSRDSAWIYFTWRQPSDENFWTRDLWRVRHETGEQERVTTTGDVIIGRESADGSTLLLQSNRMGAPLLVQSDRMGGPLLSRPIAGGPSRTLASCAWGMTVSATATGVYYIPCNGNPAGGAHLRLITPAGVDQLVTTLDRYSFSTTPGTFAILPDGHTILYEREVHSTADLMMIEHFK